MIKIEEIMLIDDNRVDNFISQFIVEKAKLAETITVKNMSLEALDYLKHLDRDFPELIFLDIKMPDMDGFGFLKEFAKFPKKNTVNTSIVMLTSSHHPEDIKRASNNPFVKHYIIKPLDIDKLSEALKIVF